MALPKLTPKQAAFIHEYLKDLNATQAVLRAGYNMTNSAARTQGARLLANANVQKGIEEMKRAREAKSMITVEWVLQEIAKIATDEEARHQDKLKALELLGKHLGMWEKREDPNEQGVKVVFETEMEVWSE